MPTHSVRHCFRFMDGLKLMRDSSVVVSALVLKHRQLGIQSFPPQHFCPGPLQDPINLYHSYRSAAHVGVKEGRLEAWNSLWAEYLTFNILLEACFVNAGRSKFSFNNNFLLYHAIINIIHLLRRGLNSSPEYWQLPKELLVKFS